MAALVVGAAVPVFVGVLVAVLVGVLVGVLAQICMAVSQERIERPRDFGHIARGLSSETGPQRVFQLLTSTPGRAIRPAR